MPKGIYLRKPRPAKDFSLEEIVDALRTKRGEILRVLAVLVPIQQDHNDQGVRDNG